MALLPWILLLAFAVGHLGILVVTINVSHSLGINTKVAELATKVGVALIGLLSLWVGWLIAGRPWADWPLAARLYSLPCFAVAFLGLPVTTLLRHFGRRPYGTLLRWEPVAVDQAAAIGRGPNHWMLRLPGCESLRPRRLDWRVELAGLPASADGLGLLQLTDLHFSPTYDRKFFEDVADAVASRPADLVLLTGDLIDDPACIDWIVPVLSRLRGRLGQYAILGNHDTDHDTRRIADELERAGFTVIDGRWATVDAGGATIALGGTSAPWGPVLDPQERPEAEFAIVLCHTPDGFYRIASWGTVDLVLAGHNHGGQIRLPVVGPLLMPSRYSRRFEWGYYRRGRTLMYVSRGLAAKHPIRYGCPPELTTFELRVPANRADSRGEDRRVVLGDRAGS